MEITIESRERPSNDACEGAMDIQLTDGQDEIVTTGTLRNSTVDWPELAVDYDSNNRLPCKAFFYASDTDSVWYKLTGVSGGIQVSTSRDPDQPFASRLDSMPLNIHIGLECESLKCIGQARYLPDRGREPSQYFYWVAKKDETYFIQVFSTKLTEDFNLTIRREEADENDNCNGAVPLADMRGENETVSGFREYVTEESSLPTNKCGSLLYPGVWYSVQGTGTNLKVDFDVNGKNRVSFFKGNCEVLQCMGGTIPEIDFTWASNHDETYHLLAHGGNGEYAFNITDLQPPNNDQCKEAISLDTGVMHRISTVNASQNELGLSQHCGSAFLLIKHFGRSPGVWYKVTASNDPRFNALIALTNSSYNSLFGTGGLELVVYSGNCDSLTCLYSAIVKFDDPLVWLVNPGETYFLYAADKRTEEHSLLIEPIIPVSNDRCVGAIPLRVGDTVRGSAVNATLDIDIPDCQEEFTSAGVWYKVVVGPNDIVSRLRISTADSYNAPFAIFSGDCQQLDCVNSLILNGPTGHYASISVEAGETYYIMVVMLQSSSYFYLRVQLDFDPAPAGPVCFPGEALVETLDSGMVAMHHLVIGDKVNTGLSGFARVYSFGHKKDSKSHAVHYVHIEASDAGVSLKISPNHLLFVNGNFVPASTVVIGDDILVGEDGNAGQVATATVSKVTLVVRRGAYAPFTATGTIMVDNVLVSSYVTLQRGMDGYLATWRNSNSTVDALACPFISSTPQNV